MSAGTWGADTHELQIGANMTDINVDVLGPVDYLVVGFPAEKSNFSGEMATELKKLIDSNTIRVLDLLMIMKGDDGSVEASELRDADDSEIGELRVLERELAILLAEEDVEEIGASLEPGSAAAVLVWENTWAAPFGSAVRRSGGELLGNGRIPSQARCTCPYLRSSSTTCLAMLIGTANARPCALALIAVLIPTT